MHKTPELKHSGVFLSALSEVQQKVKIPVLHLT